MSLEDIGTLQDAMGTPGYVPNTAQRRLAEEVTKFVHGDEALEQALQATEVSAECHPSLYFVQLSGNRSLTHIPHVAFIWPQALKPGSSTKLDASTLETVAGDAPSASLHRDQVVGLPLVDVMVAVGLQTSKSQGRK